ncbi:metallophosphoesterase family protein [Methylorubrum zatmanii]|uniref:Metallophosphoesterase family protein n=1 Tax=Methylorubrum zatmanii TaxID=29429 RepID=A0ABW1WNR4_9HYPH|nr:metallophosphoesterase family protein [Methylorubrum zatmanii]MBD8909414.1 metallophosphoesterase [Methylorubrum zatmanii]
MARRNTFFTADTHFSHEGIIRMCKRPFTSVAEMNRCLVEIWNARVGKDDTVWHLGDFALGATAAEAASIFRALNGKLRLVKGNHDGPDTLALPWAGPVEQLVEMAVDGARVVACHYPLRAWRGSFGRTLQLFGHTHDLLPPSSLSYDVGVDSWAYAPVTIAEIRSKLSSVTEEPEERRMARLRKAEAGPTEDED